MALSYTWNTIASSQTDADSPLDETLMEAIRQNIITLKESITDSGSVYTLSESHDHDGTNSKEVTGVAADSIGWGELATSQVVNSSLSISGTGTTPIALTSNDASMIYFLPALYQNFVSGTGDTRVEAKLACHNTHTPDQVNDHTLHLECTEFGSTTTCYYQVHRISP